MSLKSSLTSIGKPKRLMQGHLSHVVEDNKYYILCDDTEIGFAEFKLEDSELYFITNSIDGIALNPSALRVIANYIEDLKHALKSK